MNKHPHSIWYDEGKHAAELGLNKTMCPYKPWSYGYSEWMRGYIEFTKTLIG